jgi:hypothetical protein
MTKYDLELRFKELALARHNMDREIPVDKSDVYFQSYLEGMVWSMVDRKTIEEWIEFYERKLAE